LGEVLMQNSDMSLPHALLTALIERPSSGFDLAARFDKSMAYFWQASHQQIYRELARLEEAGWVCSSLDESARGGKKVYRVLDAGRTELRRWVAEPSDPRPLREELMVKMRAEAAVGPSGLKHEIGRRMALHQAQLAVYQMIEARDFPPGASGRAQRLQHLVLQAGIQMETLWIEFSRQAQKVLADSGDTLPREEPAAESGEPNRG
jgi:DNA-binding PadR family transcriptional regulator